MVKFVRAHGESPFAGRVTFLDASHDGKSWERVGYLTAMDYERTPPDNKDWHTLNEESYRYYRIIIKQGDLPIEGRRFPQLKLGYEHRRLVSGTPRRFSAGVPLLRFVNGGLTNDKKYYIFSYYLPREVGIDFTTEPSQRFDIYNLRWVDERGDGGDLLRPTLKDNWHSDNLFQLSYKVDGYLSVNIPADKAIKFRKRTTFFRLIILSYLLQSVVLVIWVRTWRKSS